MFSLPLTVVQPNEHAFILRDLGAASLVSDMPSNRAVPLWAVTRPSSATARLPREDAPAGPIADRLANAIVRGIKPRHRALTFPGHRLDIHVFQHVRP